MSDVKTPPKLTPSGLSSLMCARICHDLLSPVSALIAGIEVLNDDSNTDMHEDAIELIKSSTGQTSGKLQFLRLAFGAGGSTGDRAGIDFLKTLVAGQYGGAKQSFKWTTQLSDIEKIHGRILLNLIMVAVTSIPRGGELEIKVEEKSGATIFTLKATGKTARISDMIKTTLSGRMPEDGFEGHSIQPFFTAMLVREVQGKVEYLLSEETATYVVFIPAQS
ncbi:MAG: histidine phosphotransferase family protein [Maricaulaceae bacterium]